MQDVPKIVRERLKAAPVGASLVDHPDANVLTAFAERSLAAPERNTVLAHLSRCVDCRDIVALALPPVEAAPGFSSASASATSATRSGWLAWPAIRWGFVAVAVVAVASVGIVEYRGGKSQTTARLQTDTRPAPVADDVKEPNPAPVPATAASEKIEKAAPAADAEAKVALSQPSGLIHNAPTTIDTKDAAKSSVQLSQRGANVGGPGFGRSGFGGSVHGSVSPGGPYVGSQYQQRVQQQAQVLPPRVLVMSPSGVGAAASASVPAASRAVNVQAQAGNAEVAQNQPASPAAFDDAKDEAKVISRSKPSEATSETVEVAAESTTAGPVESTVAEKELPKPSGEAMNGRNFSELVVLAPASSPLWTISAKGALRRSNDQGSTWKDVNIVAATGPTSGFANNDANAVAIIAEPSAVAKKADRQLRKQSAMSTIFRTVTATGADVWAGGSNAALYHSTDGGDHWMQVLPASGSLFLTGDVVALEFLDPQHGKVTTSTAEVWTTADAGQTWQKQ